MVLSSISLASNKVFSTAIICLTVVLAFCKLFCLLACFKAF